MEKIQWGKSIISCMLAIALMFCTPLEAMAQSVVNQDKLLSSDTPLVLRVDEAFNSANKATSGVIPAVVNADVYSADGSLVVIKAGTPAYINFSAESNGAWGKAGKICLLNATTKTIDNKNVSLRLSSCKSGGSKIGGVIALSVLLFPIGLISGCMKGSMPKIQSGTMYDALTTQNIMVGQLQAAATN